MNVFLSDKQVQDQRLEGWYLVYPGSSAVDCKEETKDRQNG
jgi:hypothetical protein